MSETDSKPTLSLGEPPGRLANRTPARFGTWMWILLTLQIATLGALIIFVGDSGREESVSADSEQLEQARSLAIALEDRSLPAEAAAAWREYLQLAGNAEDRSEVLYRIGGLSMDAGDYSSAVTALVESEQLAEADHNLTQNVGPKIVECLRRLGRYGEVGRELSRRVEVDAEETAQGQVLATYAGESFTEADLDRMIERNVDRVIAMQPSGAFQLSREQILQQYETAEARQHMLQEFMQRELFSRRARELKIDGEDAFIESLDFFESEMLAGRFLSRELETVQPTDVDVKSYYDSHKSDYLQPETASVLVAPIQEGQSAEELLANVNSADDFRKLAAKANNGNEVTPLTVVKGRAHPQLGDVDAVFALSAGEWTKSPLKGSDEQLLALVESKTPAATPPLEQIRFRVEADYRAIKQQELSKRLFDDLTSRYDVRIVRMPTARSRKSATDSVDNSAKDGGGQ